MTIAPVIKTVDVKEVRAGPRLRTLHRTHGGLVAGQPSHRRNSVRGHRHPGRSPAKPWFERGEGSAETLWGKVLAWTPPGRVLLAWQLRAVSPTTPSSRPSWKSPSSPMASERAYVEHRNLERFGARREAIAKTLGGGWPTIVEASLRSPINMEEGV